MRNASWSALILCLFAGMGRTEESGPIRYYQAPSSPTGMACTGSGCTFTNPILGSSTANFVGPIGLGNTIASPYTRLYSAAANTLELRNGGTFAAKVPQSLQIYDYCEGANCATATHGAKLLWGSDNIFRISPFAGGTAPLFGTLSFSNDWQAISFGSAPIQPLLTNTTVLGDAALLFKTLYLGPRGLQGSGQTTLVPATPTTFATIACPQTAGANFCGGKVNWQVYETDGVDTTTISGTTMFNAANKAGTETCAAVVDSQTAIVTTSGADTLTCTMTCVTGLADMVGLAAECTDGGTMTETSFFIKYRFDMPEPNTVTPGT